MHLPGYPETVTLLWRCTFQCPLEVIFWLGKKNDMSESRMSCRMLWFIRIWFLNLFCHCLTIFPTHSRVFKCEWHRAQFSHSLVPCYHFSYLKTFRYLLIFFLSITGIPPLITVVVGEWNNYMRDFASVNCTNLSHNPGEKSVSVSQVPCVSQRDA